VARPRCCTTVPLHHCTTPCAGFGKPMPGFYTPPPEAVSARDHRLTEVEEALRSRRASYAEAAGMKGVAAQLFGVPLGGGSTARTSPRTEGGGGGTSSRRRSGGGEVNPIVFAPIVVQIDEDTVASCRAARGGYTIDVSASERGPLNPAYRRRASVSLVSWITHTSFPTPPPHPSPHTTSRRRSLSPRNPWAYCSRGQRCRVRWRVGGQTASWRRAMC